MLALALLIALPFMIWSAGKCVHLARESARWPSVPGVVTASDKIKRTWKSAPRVTYMYKVEGQDYSGSNIYVGAAMAGKGTDAILSRYPLGSAVTVYYSPRNPGLAALEPGPNRYASALFRTYLTCFLVILGSNAILYWVNKGSASHNDAGQQATTYDDATAANPGLGDRLLRQGADNGDAKDERYVGVWYLGGLEGYPKDPAQAAAWFRKSAEQGDAGSQALLGELYAGGNGVPKDWVQAVQWLRKAADQNDPHGCLGMGAAYEKGRGGMPKDRDMAIEWYKKAGDDPIAHQALERLGAQ